MAMTYAEQMKMAQMEDAVRALKQKVEEQNSLLENLGEQANLFGVVTEIRGKRMTVAAEGKKLDVKLFKGCKVGDHILCIPQTMQVMEIVASPTAGPIGIARTDTVNGSVEVDVDGQTVLMASAIKVAAGDRVVVEPFTRAIVIRSLGAPPAVLNYEQDTKVSWEDVGGCAAAKQALREAIEMPFAHADLYNRYGKSPVKGVLLYGPPGNGKTLLAKAAATAVARAHGESVARGFQYIKGPALLSKWVGETEAAIRAMFSAARAHKKKHGYPALIFIDEADALLSTRGSRGSVGVEGTTVPQFLAEMDGLEDSGALVLLATNRPDTLDPAVVREGRVDRKVRVDRPNREEAALIMGIHMKGKPVHSKSSLEELCAHGVDELFSPDRYLTARGHALPLANLVSGAMIAGVVDQATTAALFRDVDSKRRTCSGLTTADLTRAVEQVMLGLRDLDHADALGDMLKSRKSHGTNQAHAADN
jgi:proteasome ATPase